MPTTAQVSLVVQAVAVLAAVAVTEAVLQVLQVKVLQVGLTQEQHFQLEQAAVVLVQQDQT
jgi:hypothetical protein